MYITARLGLHSAESAHLGCALMKTCGGHRGLLTVLLIHRIHIFYGGRRTPLISFSPSLHSLSPPLPPPSSSHHPPQPGRHCGLVRALFDVVLEVNRRGKHLTQLLNREHLNVS